MMIIQGYLKCGRRNEIEFTQRKKGRRKELRKKNGRKTLLMNEKLYFCALESIQDLTYQVTYTKGNN
jgi:hypothetical protein